MSSPSRLPRLKSRCVKPTRSQDEDVLQRAMSELGLEHDGAPADGSVLLSPQTLMDELNQSGVEEDPVLDALQSPASHTHDDSHSSNPSPGPGDEILKADDDRQRHRVRMNDGGQLAEELRLEMATMHDQINHLKQQLAHHAQLIQVFGVGVHQLAQLKERPAAPEMPPWARRVKLPVTHTNALWSVSWLSFLAGWFALHQGHFVDAVIPFGVWFTSLNYWRKPDYSWRRYADIAFVQVGGWWSCARALDVVCWEYYLVMATAVSCFGVSMVFYERDRLVLSTLLHAMVHVLGNVANVLFNLAALPPVHQAWFVAGGAGSGYPAWSACAVLRRPLLLSLSVAEAAVLASCPEVLAEVDAEMGTDDLAVDSDPLTVAAEALLLYNATNCDCPSADCATNSTVSKLESAEFDVEPMAAVALAAETVGSGDLSSPTTVREVIGVPRRIVRLFRTLRRRLSREF